MRRLRKYLDLRSVDKVLVIRAVLLLWAVRIELWLLPFHAVRRVTPLLVSSLAPSRITTVTPGQIGLAVGRARSLVGCATCLVEALVIQGLLDHAGFSASLRLGAGRDTEGRFRAHAWVEVEGRVAPGSWNEGFTPFTVVQQVRS
jgi:hypothetical protein